MSFFVGCIEIICIFANRECKIDYMNKLKWNAYKIDYVKNK